MLTPWASALAGLQMWWQGAWSQHVCISALHLPPPCCVTLGKSHLSLLIQSEAAATEGWRRGGDAFPGSPSGLPG